MTKAFLDILLEARVSVIVAALNHDFPGWQKEIDSIDGLVIPLMSSNYYRGFKTAKMFRSLVHSPDIRVGQLMSANTWGVGGALSESPTSGLTPPGTAPPEYMKFAERNFDLRVPKSVLAEAPNVVSVARQEFIRFRISLYLMNLITPGFIKALLYDPWSNCPMPVGYWSTREMIRTSDR